MAEIETAVVVVAECRHYDSGGIAVGEWKVAERDGQRKRQPFEHHVCRAYDNIAARFHFAFCDLEIKMRVIVMVAGCVSAVFDVEYVGGVFFACAAGKVAFALLRYDVADDTLLRFEVVAHCLGFVVGAVVVEHRFADYLAYGVFAPDGEDCVVA